EVQSFVAVQDLGQRAVVNVADRAVEKTRPYRAVGLDHRGYPRCVAPRSHCLHMPESCSEMKRDASKFVRLLHDKPGFEFLPTFTNQGFNLEVKAVDFAGVQSDPGLTFVCPAIRPIKGGRSRVDSQERERVQIQFVRRADDI